MLVVLRRSYITFKHRLFFFNDTATTEIYTLSLHDALPISGYSSAPRSTSRRTTTHPLTRTPLDRKSTRLNSSHSQISYAVFCLKKKINNRSHHGRCSHDHLYILLDWRSNFDIILLQRPIDD